MAQDVAKRGAIVRILALHLELELGQIRVNRLVPLHAPLVHQHPDERRGERLRRRADEERRIRRDRRLPLDVRDAESSSEDRFIAAHDREHRARHVQIDAIAIELRRQAVEPLRNRGSGLLWRDDGLRECSPGNPKRLTFSNSKAEIERTDTWSVMSCKSFLASLQLLVARRESFLTRLGLFVRDTPAATLKRCK